MNRRQFLRAGAAAGACLALGEAGRALAAGQPDLAAVRGGEPETMFDRGIEALGGMKRFVRKGQKVVVKPNIGFAVGDRAANTNPRLVRRVVEQCYAAGASVVHVFDHSAEGWERAYRLSGIEEAARAAGAKVAPAHTEGYYHEIALPGGVSLKTDKVHELLLESDVLINVPVLKHHASTQLTVGMKNLMGVVWNRQRWHGNDLEQCIADFAGWRKPDLVVVDAYDVMVSAGPRGFDEFDMERKKAQLLGTDPVAVDAAAARLFGRDPASVRHIQLAAAQGHGRIDLDRLDIRRILL